MGDDDDVAELRAEIARLQAELTATRALHEATIESLPFDFWARDVDGVCVSLNSACRTTWGNLLGQRPEDAAAPPEVIAVWLANNARALAGDIVHGDVDYVVNGETRHIHNVLGPIRQADAIVGTLGVNLDITELRHAEAERLRLERKLRDTQRLETIGLLAGGVAHDINNIVMIILGIASVARRHAGTGSKLDADLSTIETASRRAAAICHQLLAFAGKGQLAVELLELDVVVAETLRLVTSSLPPQVTLELQAARRLAIEADPTQLRQLVMNLMLNGAEAIGEAAGTVTNRVAAATPAMVEAVAADDPSFTPEPSRDYVVIEVTDTGGGMSAETRARVFEPFFTTKSRGRGLGLAAALGTVRAHAGGLQVDTRAGSGSTFRVLLPRSARELEPVALFELLDEWRGSGAALVVDDDRDVASAAARMLASIGFDAVVARGGHEALTMLDGRDDIGLVLLDLMMPGLDGAATLERIRASHPRVTVVLMSGFHDVADPALRTRVLAKPFSLGELARVVRDAIASRG
jgi:signal transduction histidine kinase/CheY-like chemotaxis protein